MPFEKRSIDWGGKDRGYQLYRPPQPPKGVILFLHGMGESGEDNEVQANVGIGPALIANPDRWPFLVVLPQKADAGILWPAYSDMIDHIIRDVDETVDTQYLPWFLTGLSQGGNGSLTLFPSLEVAFSAVAPVCGWADPRLTHDLAGDLPLWLFHGTKDPVVPASCSQAIYDWMTCRNAKNKRLTLFPEADHNSWDDAYQKSELPEWLLGQI